MEHSGLTERKTCDCEAPNQDLLSKEFRVGNTYALGSGGEEWFKIKKKGYTGVP